MSEVTIQEQFKHLRPFLIGEPKQFATYQGDIYCLRANPKDPERKDPKINPCEGCPHFETGCEIADEREIEATYSTQDGGVTGLQPHVRRGIGIEERSFLVLRFKEGHAHATLPRELWDNPYADKAMDEANLHFVLTDPRSSKFLTIKGQLRFYGTAEEFGASAYRNYLEVFDTFEPQHRLASLDLSAIEPRANTVVTREPEWMKVFQGTPKPIGREVTFQDAPTKLPDYVYTAPDGRTFCYLDGEMDKVSFEQQCRKCPLVNLCETKTDLIKRVADDWHWVNAQGLYGTEYANNAEPYVKKELRSGSKVVGLAITYGGSDYTVSKTMRCTREEAKIRVSNFLSKLQVLRAYMNQAKAELHRTGMVKNRFGRRRDMRKWLNSQAVTMMLGSDGKPMRGPDGKPFWVPDEKARFKDKLYAERTALNYPIQGISAELLKMAKIRLGEMIEAEGWNPLAGLGVPQQLVVGGGAWRSLAFAVLSTVHDELVNLIRDDMFETAIPRAYRVMQLSDVMAALQTGFELEMDCEFDPTRSWTALKKFQTAKIYLLNYLAQHDGGQITPGSNPRPNLATVRLQDCAPEFAAACDSYAGAETPDGDLRLAIEVDGERVMHPGHFSRDFLHELATRTRTPIDLSVM